MTAESRILDDRSLDILFREARTLRSWKKQDVSDVLIRAMYDLFKLGPTSANCCPARVVFVKSASAKERLKPHLDSGNVEKTMTAPVTAVIACDLKFYEHMDFLAPGKNLRKWFENDAPQIEPTARRNGTLQGAYLLLAARALGLDCGPMSGFNKEGVRKEFFPEGGVEVDFLCNIGYGDRTGLKPRQPRLSFDDACEIL